MQTLLQAITSRHQTSAVLVTHDIDEALILADRVLLLGMYPGRLIGQWHIDLPHPRDEVIPELARIRLEIVQTLRDARRAPPTSRSEERREGTECVSTCRSRWSPDHSKKHKLLNTP